MDKIFPSEYHFIKFNENNCMVVYDILTGIIFKADDLSMAILDYIKGKDKIPIEDVYYKFRNLNYEIDTINEILSELKQFELISFKEKLRVHDWSKTRNNCPSTFSPINVSLNITHKCNLNCVYCYGDGGSFGSKDADMTEDIAFKTIDWLIANIKRTGSKKGSIIFFGGEPLMNFQLIPPTIEYANARAQEEAITINFGMTTNGTLLTKEYSEFLFENKIQPLISIDGPKEIQDYQRPFKNGKSSYESTISGMKNYFKVSGIKLTARVTHIDYDLVNITNSLFDAGFGMVFFSTCTGKLGEEFLTATGTIKMKKAYEDLHDVYLAKLLSSSQETRFPRSVPFVNSMRDLFYRKSSLWPCGAGRAYAGVSPDGSIYLCHRFVGNEEYKLGNVRTGINNNFLYKRIITESGSRTGACETCWARSLCAGGCYHHNLLATDDILKTHPEECNLKKSMIELAIKNYYTLYEQDQKKLKQLCNFKGDPVEHKPYA